MEFLHHYDAETRKLKLRKPVSRPDAAPPDENPIRAFREELRLTRDALAEKLEVPAETLRSWERHRGAFVPSGWRLQKLLVCARRNLYPLFYVDIILYVEKTKGEKHAV